MQLEFPPNIDPAITLIIRVQGQPWTCGMLHTGHVCGADAEYIGVCQRKDGSMDAVAMCETCRDEMGLEGEKVTAYWRSRQHEWGVR